MKNSSVSIGVKTVRIADSVVNNATLAILLLLLAVGLYAMWDSKQVYDVADSARYEVYKPTDAGESHTFEELQAINPEVLAWLTVYGTHIDYPVAQAADNMKYVNTDAEGRYSLSGSIFLDAGNSPDFSDFNSILYGHHMEDQVMFGEISSFLDKAYFDAREYGALYYGDRWRGLQFFAFLRADAYDGSVFRAKVEGPVEQQAYLDRLIGLADYTRDIGVTTDDRIILLSTCSPSPTNGRDILVGRITDEVHIDPFAVPGGAASVGDAESKTDWLRLIITQAGLAAAAILAIYLNHRRNRDDNEKKDSRKRRRARITINNMAPQGSHK
jgi:sortase B